MQSNLLEATGPAAVPQSGTTKLPTPPQRRLSADDAVDIWIARWLRVRRKDLVQRYGCDPRRLYEIWEGKKHPAARAKALERFRVDYPSLVDRVDFGPHQTRARNPDNPDQMVLFEEMETGKATETD